MNENNSFNNTQANAQANAQNTQAGAQAANAEPKTVLNGKVVPLKFAQAAEQAFNENAGSMSGVQPHHDNTSESVPAGKIASQSQSMAESAEVQAHIKKANVQSSQEHLEQAAHQAQQNTNMQQQQAEQQATHKQAAAEQQAAEQKAKARAKKE